MKRNQMKHIIIKYRGLAVLILLFIFSLHINAIFEGRNDNLKQYQSVRNQVELSDMNQVQAHSVDPGDGKPSGPPLGSDEAPISDSPLFVLLLGGLGCSTYVFMNSRKFKRLLKRSKY